MPHKYIIGRQASILAYILEHGSASGQELVTELGIRKNTAYAWLSHLTEKRILHRREMGSISRWFLDVWIGQLPEALRPYIEQIQDAKTQEYAWLGMALDLIKRGNEEYGRARDSDPDAVSE